MNLYQQVTQQILELMQTHGSDWTKPWSSAGAPTNALTQANYQGLNVILLGVAASHHCWTNYWATYKQWQELGAQVQKGERASHGMVYKPWTREDDAGNEKKGLMARSFAVFNAAQVKGWEPPATTEGPAVELQDTLQDLLVRTKTKVAWGVGAAWYSPSRDLVGMPRPEEFSDATGLAATLLHELTHWTGHPSRLNRIQTGHRSDPRYAFEELVAELGSALLCMSLGVTHTPRVDHAKYLNGWIALLQDSDRAFASAAGQAQKAATFILETNDAS